MIPSTVPSVSHLAFGRNTFEEKSQPEPTATNFNAFLTQKVPKHMRAGQKDRQMAVSLVCFTQNTVLCAFSDGTSVADLTQKLASGAVYPGEIDPIRVVYHQSRFWSLDNRRLRAFKDSHTSKVPVVVVDLKDPDIKREFWCKKTNKSLDEGGDFRSRGPFVLSREQFEQGIYVFNKRVLNWTLDWINQPMSEHLKAPLCDKYSDQLTYYKSFEALIFEEARAILQVGIQEVEEQKEYSLQLSLVNLKDAKKAENPTEMKFKVSLGFKDRGIKPCDAFLLEPVGNPDFRVVALANYSPLDPLCPELSFKVVVDGIDRVTYGKALEAGQLWRGAKLGSLITLQRMFDACSYDPEKPLSFLQKYILSGQDPLLNLQRELTEVENQLLSSLNFSQKKAVEKFLQLEEGVETIQGPPGTGKTTTVVQLLGALQARQERVLVTAPSNKAVHILAERFMSKFPDIPILLVGVEEKLPNGSPLNSILIGLWANEHIKCLDGLKERLWLFQPQKLLKGSLRFIQNRVKRKCKELLEMQEHFESFINDLRKYRLSSLEEIEPFSQELEQSVKHYCDYISSRSSLDWEKAEFYYRQHGGDGSEMPEWVGVTRSFISTMATILSSLQQKLSNLNEEELLNHSQLVFTTLSVSGQQRFKSTKLFDTLVVDEAGQALEAEVLIPIKMNPKKCLLIGDIQQLPATVTSQDAEKLKFGRSMMERLIENCGQPFSMLKTQYRMRPEISSWPSQKYYQNLLENDSSVCQVEYSLKEVGNEMPFLAPYSFIHIDGQEEKGSFGRSFFNIAEVENAALIIHHLAQTCLIDIEARVSIISFYSSQVERIQGALNSRYPKIKVNTVDGFQGGESDIVIISCVRANYEKQIGFLRASKRLNVALTRARFSLIILGNQPTLARSDIAELVADAEKRNVLFSQDVIEKLRRSFQRWTPQSQPKNKSHLGFKQLHPLRTLEGQNQPNQKTQICFEFSRTQSCRFGDHCRFQHDIKGLDKNKATNRSLGNKVKELQKGINRTKPKVQQHRKPDETRRADHPNDETEQ